MSAMRYRQTPFNTTPIRMSIPPPPASSPDDARPLSLPPLAAQALLIGIGLGALFGKQLNPWLSYDRDAVLHGQVWRLLSGNFVHLNLNHGFMNMATLAVAIVLFLPLKSLRWWALALLSCCLAVGIGLLLFSPQVSNYVGLSGALYGVLAAGLLLRLMEPEKMRWLNLLVLMAIAGKVIEQQLPSFDPNYLRAFIGGRVVADAHLYGLICGLLIALIEIVSRRRHGHRPPASAGH